MRNVLRKCKNNDHITEMHKIANDENHLQGRRNRGQMSNYPLVFGIFKQNLFHQMSFYYCLPPPTQIIRASVVSNVPWKFAFHVGTLSSTKGVTQGNSKVNTTFFIQNICFNSNHFCSRLFLQQFHINVLRIFEKDTPLTFYA